MCLGTVDKKLKIPKSMIGYKVMFLHRDTGMLTGRYFDGRPMSVGGTYTDRKHKPITARNDEMYPTGFHINRGYEGADSSLSAQLVTVKVKFDKVVATGIQFSERIVVARRITILKVL